MSTAQQTTETLQQAARRIATPALREGYKPQALHEYRDTDGSTLFWRIRCKHEDGRKWIRPMHLNGAGYSLGEPTPPEAGKSLYRLDELNDTATIWLVEGENCADALAELGLTATTSGGSSSACATDWTPLQNRRVVIWMDNDDAGRKYANEVACKLESLDCIVSFVAADVVATLPGSGDIVDWLAEHSGATADDITALPREPADLVMADGESDGDENNPSTVIDEQQYDAVEYVGYPEDIDGTPQPYFELIREQTTAIPRPGVFYIDVKRVKSEGLGTILIHCKPQWLCSPLRVAAFMRDGHQRGWGRLLEFPDRDGHMHRWAMSEEMLAGDSKPLRAKLLREGLRLTTNRSLRLQLETYLQWAAPSVTARSVKRTGWHGNTFVLPRKTYGDSDTEPVLLEESGLDTVNLGQSGSLEEWRDNVAAPCAGNSRLVLAMSMAFAGPCLGLLDTEGGGVHLRGPSASGKSTAQHVAASVYGPPEGYSQSWRATDNGLEGCAAQHSDMLLVLDELGQLDARYAEQVAYLLANGKGKQRGRRDGSSRAVKSWRVLFLSSGEIGLRDLVTQSGGLARAGQEVRVIDLPADAGRGLGLFDAVSGDIKPGAFADKLKAAANKQHGTALPVFVEWLTRDANMYRDILEELRKDIAGNLVDTAASGQVCRVANRFALIAAAGELASSLGLTGWRTNEATKAAQTCFSAWLNNRDTKGDAEPAAMLAQVRAYLEANGEARFTRWDAAEEGHRTVNRAGFRKHGNNGPTFYVERETFRQEVCKGFDHREVARVLIKAGALLPEGPSCATRKERLPDKRSTRVYVITPALWDDS